MYLLIAHTADGCCGRVEGLLRAAGHSAITTVNPLVGDAAFSWMLTTDDSRSTIRLRDRADITHDALCGVFVRMPSGTLASQGWNSRDLAYVQAEANAALVAWLRSLTCRVVNRPSADLWFRPHRPVCELRTLFDRCGLPSLDTLITNDPAEGRQFAERWNGRAVYAPLTSSRRYGITDDAQWTELAAVMERVPVCLIEPMAGPPVWATTVGADVVWSDPADLSAEAQRRFDDGLLELAALLDVDVLQVELRSDERGPRCAALVPYPQFETYAAAAQDRIAGGIVQLLVN